MIYTSQYRHLTQPAKQMIIFQIPIPALQPMALILEELEPVIFRLRQAAVIITGRWHQLRLALASADHLIQINRSTNSCAASSTITVTVGDASNKLINPAPISTGHTQGAADVYTLNVKTRDGSDNTLDQSNIKVAVIEGVLVSATVEETLAVTIAESPVALQLRRND